MCNNTRSCAILFLFDGAKLQMAAHMDNHPLRSVTFTFVNSSYVLVPAFTTNAVLTICNLPSKTKAQKQNKKHILT